MGSMRLRVIIGAVIILGAMTYFGFAGFQEGKTYYKTVEELSAMGDLAYGKPLRVAGIVADGTIEREGTQLTFRLTQNDLTLPVLYTGTTPVPDTFKDGAEAICEGTYTSNGVFEAKLIQAGYHSETNLPWLPTSAA